jgi:F0F1-type ATP synthase assembly protein I
MGRLSSIIMILPGSMAAGWFLGYYILDRYLTRFPWGSLGLTFLGAGAGFYEIIRLLMLDQGSNGDGTEGNES